VSRRSNYARQTIDCVVVEIDLPDMSGFQVLASLVPGASRPETAVVVYTSLPNPYLSELALKNGARAALRKIAPVTNLLDRSILDAISRVKKDRERFNDGCHSFCKTVPFLHTLV
jgi:Response regulator containing a CheY-like receiver domain and an HTH DNA-binding domain